MSVQDRFEQPISPACGLDDAPTEVIGLNGVAGVVRPYGLTAPEIETTVAFDVSAGDDGRVLIGSGPTPLPSRTRVASALRLRAGATVDSEQGVALDHRPRTAVVPDAVAGDLNAWAAVPSSVGLTHEHADEGGAAVVVDQEAALLAGLEAFVEQKGPAYVAQVRRGAPLRTGLRRTPTDLAGASDNNVGKALGESGRKGVTDSGDKVFEDHALWNWCSAASQEELLAFWGRGVLPPLLLAQAHVSDERHQDTRPELGASGWLPGFVRHRLHDLGVDVSSLGDCASMAPVDQWLLRDYRVAFSGGVNRTSRAEDPEGDKLAEAIKRHRRPGTLFMPTYARPPEETDGGAEVEAGEWYDHLDAPTWGPPPSSPESRPRGWWRR